MSETLLQVVLAIFVGGLIGWEREFRTGSGMRTMMLVCLGSTLFTIYSYSDTDGLGDPRRIAAAVVTGIGFLGAGMILRHQRNVIGLTTAATVWLTAALGMGLALSEYQLVILSTALVLSILWAIPYMRRLRNLRETLTYEIVAPIDLDRYEHFLELLEANDLRLTQENLSKNGQTMTCTWRVYGTHAHHKQVMEALLNDPTVETCHIF